MDEASIAQSKKGEGPWTKESATSAQNVYVHAPSKVVVIALEITHRNELLAHPLTQILANTVFGVKPVGVRMCCPDCRSNKYVHCMNVHELKHHRFSSKTDRIVDLEYCCCNLSCEPVKAVIQTAYNANIAVPLQGSRTFANLKKLNLLHKFYGSDMRLLTVLLPASVGADFDVFTRKGSSIDRQFRNHLYSIGNETLLLEAIKKAHQEHHLYTTCKNYRKFVRRQPKEQQKVFTEPPQNSPPLSTLATIIDEMYHGGDREKMIRYSLMRHSIGRLLKWDCTFKAVKLISGGNHVLLIIHNEHGFIVFVAIMPTEAGKYTELAHQILRARWERGGETDFLGLISDTCCKGGAVPIWKVGLPGGDSFHYVARITKTLCAPNKLSVGPIRDAFLKRVHNLIWHPLPSEFELVQIYNKYATITFEDLLNINEPIYIIDSIRLVRDLMMESFEKEERAKEDSYKLPKHKLTTAAQAIRFIRMHPSRFNAYVREEKMSIKHQEKACLALIQEVEKPSNTNQENWKWVVTQPKPPNVKGTAEQLKLHLFHVRKGCTQPVLPLEEQFDEVVGPKSRKVKKWAPKGHTSGIEAGNKQLGSPFDGMGNMRDDRVERTILLVIVKLNWSHAKSRGLPHLPGPYDFLMHNRVYKSLAEQWPDSPYAGMNIEIDYEKPLETQGLKYMEALNASNISTSLVAHSVSNSSSSSSSTTPTTPSSSSTAAATNSSLSSSATPIEPSLDPVEDAAYLQSLPIPKNMKPPPQPYSTTAATSSFSSFFPFSSSSSSTGIKRKYTANSSTTAHTPSNFSSFESASIYNFEKWTTQETSSATTSYYVAASMTGTEDDKMRYMMGSWIQQTQTNACGLT